MFAKPRSKIACIKAPPPVRKVTFRTKLLERPISSSSSSCSDSDSSSAASPPRNDFKQSALATDASIYSVMRPLQVFGGIN